ncbi:PREDICTED: S-locus-specific glycoprotein S13-like [Camelina sativa]|uniref:S-locus-specific glycoprotein S13-like n=1 Tax=Camelina sativa TaxID=90675 RepID=A0ABM0TD80_CAMSA|nr:PREDICTED: S-locus-specific glycoprotein S13-like [Camelina sativa]
MKEEEEHKWSGGVRNIVYHHFYTFSFFLVLTLFRPAFSIHVNTLSPTDSLTISSNRTIVSLGDVFDLGFFKPSSGTSRWYLGIWYKKTSERTYVWVANRDSPLSSSIGTFKISDSNLVLLDHSNNTVWSTNLTKRDVSSPVVAELLANGNFVMRYSNNNNDTSGVLWQSFDYPTDTLLPEMKLGLDFKTGYNRFLRSWRSPDDPASGNYSYKLETQGVPEFFLWSKDVPVYRTGPWNGIRFGGIPDRRQFNEMVDSFTKNKEEITYKFLMNKTNHDTYSRLRVSPSGHFQQSTWIPQLTNWSMIWAFVGTLPRDECDVYKVCGPYSYCDYTKNPMCVCIPGFMPNDPRAWELNDWSNGCVRRTELNCRRDMFLGMTRMKLPDTKTAIVDRSIGEEKECRERCNMDCNCTAFANADLRQGGSGCLIWTGELMDIRNDAEEGQNLYVRVAVADLGLLKKNKFWLIITGLELVMC